MFTEMMASGSGGDSSELVNLGSTTAKKKIVLGYKPRKLMLIKIGAGGKTIGVVYDEDVSATTMTMYYETKIQSQAFNQQNIDGIYSIDTDGFTMSNYPNTNVQYIAIK